MNYFTFQNALPINSDYNDYFYSLCEIDHRDGLISLVSFLDFSQVIHLKNTTKYLYDSIDKSVIKQYVKQGLISDDERALYYQSIIDIEKMKSLLVRELSQYNIGNDFYKQLLDLANKKNQQSNTFRKVCGDIELDLSRTFYTDNFTNGNGKEMLNDVLTAIAFIRPEIGYCQGMNFVVGALINLFNDDHLVFWIFLSFLDNIELNLLYSKNMPDYCIRIYQLNYYIKQYLPKLFTHFKKNDIDIDIFISKWIFTVFASYLSMEILAKVWDVFIIDKWKAILKFSIALLTVMQNDLMKLNMSSLSKYFRLNINNSAISYKELVKCYKRYKITNKDLEVLKDDFFIEQVQLKLDDPKGIWDFDQNECVDQYKASLDAHLKESKKKMMTLQEKIERLNKDYENAFSVYEEQVQVCLKIKRKVKELIESKTGYEIVLSHMKNEENKQRSKKNNEKKKVMFLKLFTSNDKNETEKFTKHLKQNIKDLDHYNKLMLDNYEILDKKKYIVEQIKEEKDNCKDTIEEISNETEEHKRLLIKNLSQRLKLTPKFVNTSKY